MELYCDLHVYLILLSNSNIRIPMFVHENNHLSFNIKLTFRHLYF